MGLNLAAEKNIPFVALAYSPEQESPHIQYEMTKEDLSKSWFPTTLAQGPFTENDRSYFWDPKEHTRTPRLFLPFHFLEYPGQEKIITMLSELHLGKRRAFHPFRSNCALVWLLMHLDVVNHHYNPYFEPISKQIRQGTVTPDTCPVIMMLGNWCFKTGLVRLPDTMRARKYVGIKKIHPLVIQQPAMDTA
jgi:hypothetical protein